MQNERSISIRLPLLLTGLAVLLLASWLPAAQAAGPGVHGRVLSSEPGERGHRRRYQCATIEFRNQNGKVVGQATSDENGSYKADLVAGTYYYKVQAAGYRDENCGRGIILTLSEGYHVFHFNLVKESTPNPQPNPDPMPPPTPINRLVGQVYEEVEKGKLLGIAGATVTLRRSQGGQLAQVQTRPPTGDIQDSGYKVELPIGTYQGAVIAEGFEPLLDPQPIPIEADRVSTRDFILRRKPDPPPPPDDGCLTGFAVAVKNGQEMLPPASAQIIITSLFSQQSVTPPLDPQGSYHQKVPPGYYRVMVIADGYQTYATEPKLVIASPRCARADLVLYWIEKKPDEYVLTGTVSECLDYRSGRAAADLGPRLVADALQAGCCGDPPTALTDGPVAQMKAPANPDDCQNKKPLAGATVSVWQSGQLLMQGPTDQQGGYRFVLPQPGRVPFVCVASKGNEYDPAAKEVHVTAPVTTANFVLLQERPKCTLVVKVKKSVNYQGGAQGQPQVAPNADVVVVQNDTVVANKKSDANGECRFPGLQAGKQYTIHVNLNENNDGGKKPDPATKQPGKPNEPVRGLIAVFEYEPVKKDFVLACTADKPEQTIDLVLTPKKPEPVVKGKGSITILVCNGIYAQVNPIYGAQVKVFDANNKDLDKSGLTIPPFGRCQFTDLPSGVPIFFKVSHPNFKLADVRHVINTPDFELKIPLMPIPTAAEVIVQPPLIGSVPPVRIGGFGGFGGCLGGFQSHLPVRVPVQPSPAIADAAVGVPLMLVLLQTKPPPPKLPPPPPPQPTRLPIPNQQPYPMIPTIRNPTTGTIRQVPCAPAGPGTQIPLQPRPPGGGGKQPLPVLVL